MRVCYKHFDLVTMVCHYLLLDLMEFSWSWCCSKTIMHFVFSNLQSKLAFSFLCFYGHWVKKSDHCCHFDPFQCCKMIPVSIFCYLLPVLCFFEWLSCICFWQIFLLRLLKCHLIFSPDSIRDQFWRFLEQLDSSISSFSHGMDYSVHQHQVVFSIIFFLSFLISSHFNHVIFARHLTHNLPLSHLRFAYTFPWIH